MEENNVKEFSFPESSNIIWILFILAFFNWRVKSGENFEMYLNTLIDNGASQDTIDSLKELKDKYEENKELLLNKGLCSI